MSARYAIYLAPPADSALWRFGARVLGRDAETGETIEGFAPAGYTASQWRDLTAEPRRYGFHATLKAPFRLAPGRTQDELNEAIAALAARLPAFDLGALQATPVQFPGGGFVALTPANPPPDLAALEARTLRDLDAFRAPLSDAEIARRQPERLSERQRAYLQAWGYPFVLEEFRLHFTLTGATDAPERLAQILAEAFAREVPAPEFRVDSLALFVQPDGGEFRLRRRFPLGARAG